MSLSFHSSLSNGEKFFYRFSLTFSAHSGVAPSGQWDEYSVDMWPLDSGGQSPRRDTHGDCHKVKAVSDNDHAFLSSAL